MLTNPETLLGNRPLGTVDARRAYNFRYEYRAGVPFTERVECYDDNSFDPEPGALWNIVGRGANEREARIDALEQIWYAADAEANEQVRS